MWPLVATSPNDRCLTQKLLRSQWHCLELPVPQHGKALNHPQDLGCFLMLRILLFNSLLPFYSHVPRHSLFPFSKRKLYKSFASFQELTRHHTVMEGSYIMYNPAQLIHYLAGSTTPSLTLSHISYSLSRATNMPFPFVQAQLYYISSFYCKRTCQGYFFSLPRWISS